ncbi:hypothetical protein CLF_105728 [Clonorchis sinensis]|uniref:Uncharacterized protein n=1 Tax=Clonorchis sinensis TaxID=79923 RepID=G7YE31_CLOSI|nr:hypothetical protein CLF_105728 [Clonorchis sinensis]
MVRQATVQDRVLYQLKSVYCPEDELKPYYNRRNSLLQADGCLLFSERVVIPKEMGRRSMSRAYESHRSSVNTFACSDVKIQMRPTCVGGVVVTRSPRMSDVRGSNPGTAPGYALLMSSNKSETRLPLVWTHRNTYARTGGRPFKRE